MSLAIAGISALVAGAITTVAVVSSLSPGIHRRPRKSWRRVARLADLPAGSVRECVVSADEGWPPALEEPRVFVWSPAPGEIIVFSRNCTDLGCPLKYDAGSACFLCPCHGGIFTQSGERLAGPPDRPMDRLLHRVRGGVLEIELDSGPMPL